MMALWAVIFATKRKTNDKMLNYDWRRVPVASLLNPSAARNPWSIDSNGIGRKDSM